MVPVNVTVSALTNLKSDLAMIPEVLRELKAQLMDSGFQSDTVNLNSSYKSTEDTLAVEASARDSHFIPIFIDILRNVMNNYKDIVMSIEFDGNRIKLDSLSTDRAELELRKLAERPVNITGSVIIGSSNTISPTEVWPRKVF